MEEIDLTIRVTNELADEVRSLRKQNTELTKRYLELSDGLCDMLFAFTCFLEHGIEQYPEEMQTILKEMHHKAREAFVGHEVPPSVYPPIVLQI